ncbi:MAG TPA: efflux RND transporter periplasmic adaptor subunit [Thermoanaerobaculia bacterium]|nr:efflux RND transporter periplasmic adaptor subunit [Thermoanaerobaculia bacterium]
MKRFIPIAAFTALLLAACGPDKPKPVDEAVPVTVATVAQKDIPIEIRAIGTVQPMSNVAVKALAGGQLERVGFREGDEVRKGALIFTIDPRPYKAMVAQAEANLARDEAQLRNAEADALRYQTLVKSDFVTKQDYDKFTAAAEVARATVAADRAALDNARLQLSYCEIRAPMDGRTGDLMVHAGNLVKPNDVPLVTINQVAPVYVQFSIPETNLDQVRAQRSLSDLPVAVSTKDGTTPLATGKLSFIDNAVDATTGTISLKGTFDNHDRKLWPGQFVNVALRVGKRDGALVVPAQAIQTGQRGQYVYVVKEGNAVEMRPVSVAMTIDQQTIVDRGLKPGETVVTDGQLRLSQKSHVLVKGKA